MIEDRERPAAGDLEQRAAPSAAPHMDGPRLRGLIPYGIESRDLGGWREVIEPGALRNAAVTDLIATVDHAGVPLARHPGTLTIDDQTDGLHWSLELPESRSDVREAVERGDLCAGSWRMIVGRDEWRGKVRHVHEIRELRDVSVVSNLSYAASVVEHRSAPTPPHPRRPVLPLRIEDRADPRGSVEMRIVEAMRNIAPGEMRDLTRASVAPVEPDDLRTVLLDKLRETVSMFSTGISVVSTDKKAVHWPTITGDLTAAFYNELDEIALSDLTMNEFRIPVVKIASLVRGSDEAFSDSDPSLLQAVTDNLNLTLALKADRELMIGSDVKGFKGLTNVIGSQSIAVDGPLSWDHVLRAVALLGESKVPGPFAMLLGPRPALTLALTKEETASNAYLSVPAGVPPVFSTYWLPVTAGASPTTTAVIFAPSQVTVVVRQDVVTEIDRSKGFSSDSVYVRGKFRLGMDVRFPQSIVKLTGIAAPVIA